MTNFFKVTKHKRLLYSITVFCVVSLALLLGIFVAPKSSAEDAAQPIPVLATVVVPADGGSLGVIPDNDSMGRNVTFTVSGLPSGQVVQSVSVDLTINHAWSGDLVATLESPGGARMHTIFDESGESSSNLDGTYTFDDTSIGDLCNAARTTGNNSIIPPGSYRTRDNACNLTEINPSFRGLVVSFANQVGNFKKFNKRKSKRTSANLANGTWNLKVLDDQAGDTGNVTGAQLTIVTALAPTAAFATISGRVKSSRGRGLRFVRVGLSGDNLPKPIYTTTNQFGNYVFKDMGVGETYILTVASKRYIFNPSTRVFTLYENLTGIDFVGNERF